MTTSIPLLVGCREEYRGREETLERIMWVCLLSITAATMFSIAITQTIIVGMSAVWFYVLIRSRGAKFARTPLDIPFLIFILARAISVPFSVDPSVSFPGLYNEVFFYIMFFLAVHVFQAGDSVRSMGTVLWVIVAASVAASLIGTARYTMGSVERAASTTSGYYTLGLYLTLALPFPLLLGKRGEIFRSWRIPLLAAAAMCLGIIFSFDRLHWVGMAAVILIAGLLRERRLIIAFAGATGLLALVVPEVNRRLVQLVDIGSNLSGRDVLWRGAAMIAGEHPVLGFGLRTFRLIFPIPAELPNPLIGSWHNDYLQLYFDGGLVALLGFLWLILSVYRWSWKAFRSDLIPGDERYILGALLVSVTLLFLMGGMLDLTVGVMARTFLAMIAVIARRAWQNEPKGTMIPPAGSGDS